MRLSAHIPPDSAAATAAHRALMGMRQRGIARAEDPRRRAVARALRTTALGRTTSEERAWLNRIEARRRRIPAAMVAAGQAGDAADAEQQLVVATALCRWTSIPPVWGRFLMRLVRELAPRSCLELGTGLGLSGAYQGAGLDLDGDGTLVTLDVHEASRIAEQGFSELGLAARVELRFGLIEETAPSLFEQIAPIEYAFLDAEHSEEATVRHFDSLLPHLAGRTVVVLDDIMQTDEMRRAWRTISGREGVSGTIGLRRVGVVLVGP